MNGSTKHCGSLCKMVLMYCERLFSLLTVLFNGSVLPPPPPRYTIPVAYAAGASNGMPVPVVETNNVISHPEDGCPLQVGEGSVCSLGLACIVSGHTFANTIGSIRNIPPQR